MTEKRHALLSPFFMVLETTFIWKFLPLTKSLLFGIVYTIEQKVKKI